MVGSPAQPVTDRLWLPCRGSSRQASRPSSGRRSPCDSARGRSRLRRMAQDRHIAREYLEALIIAAIFLQFANTFVVQTYYIPSGSMEDTLLIGDHLFVNRFIYGPAQTAAEKLLPFRPVHRGDIVVFRSPEDPKLDLVKRCVAVGGDTVQVINQQLFINGTAVKDSSYALHKNPE